MRLSTAALVVCLSACSSQSPPAEVPEEASPAPEILEVSLTSVGLSGAAIDPNGDPCRDFYQFACGGWMRDTPIPGDESRWVRSFNVINDDNQKFLSELLSRAAEDPGDDPVMQKLGAFYGACMDQESVDAAGVTPIRPLLETIRSIQTRADVAAAIIELHRHGIWAPWDISAVQDFKDATQVIAFVDQNGLGLPDRDYYFDEDKAEIRDEYKAHVARMFRIGGFPDRRAEGLMRRVYGMEERLAKASLPRVERRNPYNLYHKIDYEGLAALVPSFPWKKYFAALGKPDLVAINVSHEPFFSEVETLLKTTKPATWRPYLAWHVLQATAPMLSSELDAESFAFQKVLTGQEEQKPRWKRCVSATDEALGELLAQPYVSKRFAGESKAAAASYVHAISEAFRRNLPNLAWMDEAARSTAEEKLDKVAFLIGYPAEWKTYEFDVDGVYATNALVARAWSVQDDLSQLGEPVDRGRWEMTPPTVNAYYHPLKNQMVFPAGILQPPFYSVSSGVAVNLGAMGMVVGHELTHGFDDQGSKFDGDGNLSMWWSDAIRTAFETQTQCVAEQYESYEPLPGLHLKGKLTLGENIADMGGVKLAFDAYRQLRAEAERPIVAEGFTEDQQFFLATAQIWCANTREAEIRRRVQTDPHSPPRFRVNGSLSNLPEFAEAFACEEGTPMHPTNTCAVW